MQCIFLMFRTFCSWVVRPFAHPWRLLCCFVYCQYVYCFPVHLSFLVLLLHWNQLKKRLGSVDRFGHSHWKCWSVSVSLRSSHSIQHSVFSTSSQQCYSINLFITILRSIGLRSNLDEKHNKTWRKCLYLWSWISVQLCKCFCLCIHLFLSIYPSIPQFVHHSVCSIISLSLRHTDVD